jgi:hypothetical protein
MIELVVPKDAMQSSVETKARSKEIARSLETDGDLRLFQQHLREVIEGAAFRGSHRSGQFLKYIVEQAIAGQFDSLKERAIGVELFGRSPTYDTGEDAIVRVTASDVRRRLLHHYSTGESESEFHISLPPGSYAPRITRDVREEVPEETAPIPESAAPETSTVVPVIPSVIPAVAIPVRERRDLRWLIPILCTFVLANIAVWGVFERTSIHAQPHSSETGVLPWSVFFANSRYPTLLVTSDPNIAEIHALTGSSVSLSDYANQKYIPNSGSLSPEVIRICNDILRGDKAATVDTTIVARVAELAGQNSSTVNVRAARDLRFSDLDTDSNLIFLGSPRTDLWTTLFNDQLDFKFQYDEASRQEIIQNLHPKTGEPTQYIPTAKGFGTGQSFATISLIRNPNHHGYILLLAGASAEGTKAAGKLVTDIQALSPVLKRCSVTPSDHVQPFQVLLRLNMMANSPGNFDVAACHVLS